LSSPETKDQNGSRYTYTVNSLETWWIKERQSRGLRQGSDHSGLETLVDGKREVNR
jgi:hypothetical protein